MKTQYVVDGKTFNNYDEALLYEEELCAKKKEKEKLLKEKETRKKEIEDAWENYSKLRDAYLKDYNVDTSINWAEFFENFFS